MDAVDFQVVRHEDHLKQAYLDTLFPHCPTSVSALVYDPQLTRAMESHQEFVRSGILPPEAAQARMSPDSISFLVLSPMEILGINRQHPIYVSQKAFRTFGIPELFANVLIDHEGQHCSDLQEGIRIGTEYIGQHNVGELQRKTAIHLMEIRGYMNQVRRALERGITNEGYLLDVGLSCDFQGDHLREIQPKTDLERRVIEFALSDPLAHTQ